MSANGCLLGAKVVSEALRPQPDAGALAWLGAHEASAQRAVEALLAATAAHHGPAVATHVEPLGVDSVDPWA